MTYLPKYIVPAPPMISVHSIESAGNTWRLVTNASITNSIAYPTANKAFYIPFRLRFPITVTSLWTANGTNASQTRDVGIYSWDGRRIVSAGSTAGSGTSTLQVYSITATTIGPGMFYLAMASSGTTNAFLAAGPGDVRNEKPLGMFEQTTAFPLPATATFGTMVATYIPLFGLATVPTV